MNISPVAKRMIDSIKEFIAESSKKEYRFELEEEKEIQRYIAILENQLKILIDYEIKKDAK